MTAENAIRIRKKPLQRGGAAWPFFRIRKAAKQLL